MKQLSQQDFKILTDEETEKLKQHAGAALLILCKQLNHPPERAAMILSVAFAKVTAGLAGTSIQHLEPDPAQEYSGKFASNLQAEILWTRNKLRTDRLKETTQ